MRFYLYLARRILSLAPVWLAISFLAFGLGSLAPGDPAEAVYYQTFGEPPPDQAALDQIREEIGLNEPFPVRYGLWVLGAFPGVSKERTFETHLLLAYRKKRKAKAAEKPKTKQPAKPKPVEKRTQRKIPADPETIGERELIRAKTPKRKE